MDSRLFINNHMTIRRTIRDSDSLGNRPSASFGDVLQYLKQDDLLESVIIVKEAADLSGTLDSSKLYIIDGMIDLGSQSVEVPEGGISIGGLNSGRDVAGLSSTANGHTMFTSPDGGYSGNVVMENLTFISSGTGSKIFDLDNVGNFGALDISTVNFVNCTSLGSLTAYRQLLLNIMGFINVLDGLTFHGTWQGGFAVINSIAINFPAATLFKEGTDLTFAGSIRSNINFLSTHADAILFDFDEANILADGGMDLQDVRTEATNAVPNISPSSVKARFKNCSGIDNTYVGSEYTISSEAPTTISTANTLVKMAGTTVYTEEHWFSNSGSNAFVSDSAQTIEVSIQMSLSFSGVNNNVVGAQFRRWNNLTSDYTDVGARFSATMNAAGRAENVAAMARSQLKQGDRVELWVENQTSTSDITGLNGGVVLIDERA